MWRHSEAGNAFFILTFHIVFLIQYTVYWRPPSLKKVFCLAILCCYVWPSLCRMMDVQSLMLEGFFSFAEVRKFKLKGLNTTFRAWDCLHTALNMAVASSASCFASDFSTRRCYAWFKMSQVSARSKWLQTIRHGASQTFFACPRTSNYADATEWRTLGWFDVLKFAVREESPQTFPHHGSMSVYVHVETIIQPLSALTVVWMQCRVALISSPVRHEVRAHAKNCTCGRPGFQNT